MIRPFHTSKKLAINNFYLKVAMLSLTNLHTQHVVLVNFYIIERKQLSYCLKLNFRMKLFYS